MDQKQTKTADVSDEDWPNSVRSSEELDKALQDGVDSGISPRSADEIFRRALERIRNA